MDKDLKLDDCQLMFGDCLERMKEIPDNSVIVTDPPFNIGYKYSSYKDRMAENDYYDMLTKIVGFANKAVIIHYPEQLHKLSIKLGYAPEKVVSWVYNSNTGKQHRDIAYYGVKPEFKNRGEEYKNPKDKRVMKLITSGKKPRLYDWWNVNQVKNVSKDKTPHPCQMPIEVMENILKTLPDDCIIIDPFMGSGTTGVACINTNRKFIGIELDEKYYDISCKRIKNAIIEKEQELFKI